MQIKELKILELFQRIKAILYLQYAI
jgi:hypothetical protein